MGGEFSNNQRRRQEHERRCKSCVSAGEEAAGASSRGLPAHGGHSGGRSRSSSSGGGHGGGGSHSGGGAGGEGGGGRAPARPPHYNDDDDNDDLGGGGGGGWYGGGGRDFGDDLEDFYDNGGFGGMDGMGGPGAAAGLAMREVDAMMARGDIAGGIALLQRLNGEGGGSRGGGGRRGGGSHAGVGHGGGGGGSARSSGRKAPPRSYPPDGLVQPPRAGACGAWPAGDAPCVSGEAEAPPTAMCLCGTWNFAGTAPTPAAATAMLARWWPWRTAVYRGSVAYERRATVNASGPMRSALAVRHLMSGLRCGARGALSVSAHDVCACVRARVWVCSGAGAFSV